MLYNTHDWRTKSLVPVDGPAGVYLPSTIGHWSTLGLPEPLCQWNCQDTSGSLVSMGSITPALAPSGTGSANLVYNQAIPGWAARAVGGSGEVAHYFGNGDAALDFALDESWAILVCGAFNNASAGSNRYFMSAGTTSGVHHITMFFNEGIRFNTPAGYTNGINIHGDAALSEIRPYLFGRNCTAAFTRLYTNLEQITAAYSNAAVTGMKSIGANNGNSAGFRAIRYVIWRGAAAETILDRNTLTLLKWATPY